MSGRRPSIGGERATRSSRDDIDDEGKERPTRRSQDGEVFKPVDEAKAHKAREERRSRSNKAYAFGGEALRSQMADHISLGHGVSPDASAHEKMQKVMCMAKEKGMTTEDIFRIFDKNGDGQITPSEFKEALIRMNPDVFRVSDKEMADLVSEFDIDGDGDVSMEEFKNWCYQIPNLAWKAERLRLRDSGEFTTFSDANGVPSGRSSPEPLARNAGVTPKYGSALKAA